MPGHPMFRQVQGAMVVVMGLLGALPAIALPDRAIGPEAATAGSPWQGPADRSLDQLVGRHLVFLEKAPSEQAVGYPAFRVAAMDQATGGLIPSYRDYVGRKVRVDSVSDAGAGESLVTVTALDDGTLLQARTVAGSIADVAPVGDLYRARRRWLGTTIYARKRAIQTYDPTRSQYGELPVRINEALKVVDVIWGMSTTKPLWIVVQRDNGERGFIATAFSWTNLYSDWWSADRPWENKIAETSATQELKAFGIAGRLPRSFSSAATRNDESPF